MSGIYNVGHYVVTFDLWFCLYRSGLIYEALLVKRVQLNNLPVLLTDSTGLIYCIQRLYRVVWEHSGRVLDSRQWGLIMETQCFIFNIFLAVSTLSYCWEPYLSNYWSNLMHSWYKWFVPWAVNILLVSQKSTYLHLSYCPCLSLNRVQKLHWLFVKWTSHFPKVVISSN